MKLSFWRFLLQSPVWSGFGLLAIGLAIASLFFDPKKTPFGNNYYAITLGFVAFVALLFVIGWLITRKNMKSTNQYPRGGI